MPRQLFFLHTSEKLIRVPPTAQAEWVNRIRQGFAAAWAEYDAAALPSAMVYIPRSGRIAKPGGTYGRFQQAIFPSVPWMLFQRASVWGSTELDARLSAEFWRMTNRPEHVDRRINLMFVLLRDPSMPMPLKHREWLIHGYPSWPGLATSPTGASGSRPAKPVASPQRAATPS